MLFLVSAIILIFALLASAGVLLLSARMFNVKTLNYLGAVKLTLLSGLITVVPILGLKIPELAIFLIFGSVALILYVFKRSMTIGWGRAFGIYISSVLIGVFVSSPFTLGLHIFAFQSFRMVGNSMAPSINANDYLITSKAEMTIAGTSYVPMRCEIISFTYPKDPKLIFIKRVIALPGEKVVVKDGRMMVYNTTNPNGVNPDTACGLNYPSASGDFDDTIPADSIFVVGDNRDPLASLDSREFGPLPTAHIISVVKYRLTPSFKAY